MQSSVAGGGRDTQHAGGVARDERPATACAPLEPVSHHIVYPEVDEWQSVLARLSVPRDTALEIAAQAREAGSDFLSGLLASGGVGRHDLTRAMAADLGLKTSTDIDPQKLIVNDEQLVTLLRGGGDHLPVKLLEKDGSVSFLVSSKRIRLSWMRTYIRSRPTLVKHLKIADADDLRAAITARARPLLARMAVSGLSERFPEMSARVVANAWQGTVVGIAVTVLPVGLALAPALVLGLLHGFATFFFFACVALRFAAVASVAIGRPSTRIDKPQGDVPVYSVLVALYKEADIVPDLLAALEWIVWPRDRLEIKLVCEADDAETLAAIYARPLPMHIKVVEVFKGWAQTWLVHMRDPVKLATDLGPRSFMIAQVLFAGMLASAMLHPLLLATFCVGLIQLVLSASPGPIHSGLLIVDIVNITCGYLSFLLLGWQTLAKGQRRGFWKIVAFTPVYWAMLSYAGWRAVLQLWRRPFHWEKTPHQQVQPALLAAAMAPQ